MTADEMVGWHHRLEGHEFEQAPGVGDGQGGLACCCPWGCKELDVTELNCKHSLLLNITICYYLLDYSNPSGVKRLVSYVVSFCISVMVIDILL